MDAHHLAQRHGEHAVGVVEAQVLLGGEGEPMEVVEGLDILGDDPQLVELAAVAGDVLVGPVEGGLQALQLQLRQFLARHALV